MSGPLAQRRAALGVPRAGPWPRPAPRRRAGRGGPPVARGSLYEDRAVSKPHPFSFVWRIPTGPKITDPNARQPPSSRAAHVPADGADLPRGRGPRVSPQRFGAFWCVLIPSKAQCFMMFQDVSGCFRRFQAVSGAFRVGGSWPRSRRTRACCSIRARLRAAVPRVRSHHRFKNSVTEYVSESGMKRTSGRAKQSCDRARAVPSASGGSSSPGVRPYSLAPSTLLGKARRSLGAISD